MCFTGAAAALPAVSAARAAPNAIRDAVINAAAMKNRIAEMETDIVYPEKLKAAGMTINRVKIAPFQNALRAAGFYTEWRDKFPPQAWALLEKAVGKKLDMNLAGHPTMVTVRGQSRAADDARKSTAG